MNEHVSSLASAFAVAAAKVWNSLPEDVSAAPSLTLFRKRLKTVLFRRSFNFVN